MKTANEIFRKTTGKGAVLVVSLSGYSITATVDGKAASPDLKLVTARTINGKTVVAMMGMIGLTQVELDTIREAIRAAGAAAHAARVAEMAPAGPSHHGTDEQHAFEAASAQAHVEQTAAYQASGYEQVESSADVARMERDLSRREQ